MTNDLDQTRMSWNAATRIHNAHKGDQAARLRAGEELLFPEELALLGAIHGMSVAHLQCNAGQDTLCLARRGADVVGVDLADEAIRFARGLSEASGIAARFVHAELVDWMETTDLRFDVAFTSYGTTGWIADLGAWARGVARILKPGGALVYVEFHPLCWSLGKGTAIDLRGDDYFAPGPFVEPVGDYVGASGPALGVVDGTVEASAQVNPHPATAWQHDLGKIVTAVASAGLRIERLEEYPHANGCRVHPALIDLGDRRWGFPPGYARLPLMFGLRAVRG